MAIDASNPYKGTQLVNVAIKLIKKFNDFEKGLVSWFERPVVEHTMLNFKAHFEREYQALKRVRGTTMRNTSYFQQANNLSTVIQTMKEEREQILTEVKDSEYKILQAIQLSANSGDIRSDDRDYEDTPRRNQSMNNTTGDAVQLEILKLLREMRDENRKSNKSNNNQNNRN